MIETERRVEGILPLVQELDAILYLKKNLGNEANSAALTLRCSEAALNLGNFKTGELTIHFGFIDWKERNLRLSP